MALRIEAEPVPLETDRDGVVRVRGSRVTLDTIVAAFHQGATAEEILQKYPTLALADIYAIIAYCLQKKDDVEAYLRQRREQAEQIRREVEARSDLRDFRERLLARRAKLVAPPDASAGD